VKAQYPQRKKRQKILSCKFFLSDRINRIIRIFFISQLPEEAVKTQSSSGEGFSFSLFFRESENNYPVNPVNPV
jgi:hypothetical protein